MTPQTKAKRSRAAVRSGIRLTAILALGAAVGLLTQIMWLAKLSALAAAFFAVVTFIEFLNARRWERFQ
jgi:lipoprotein signal peptidase